MITRFMDMNSGGEQKLDWGYILIEAPEGAAIKFFRRKFGRDPDHVTCNCCGRDYSVSEYPSIEEATAYDRGKRTVAEYLESEDVFFIPASDM